MSEPNSHAHLWPGVPLALGSAILFGAAPPLCKLLLDSVNPFMLAGLLYLGAGAGLALYRSARGGGAGEAQLTARDIPWLLLAIGAGGIVAPVLLMFGLGLNTASSSALLLNLEGLATMAIAWLVYRENVDRRLLLGAFAIVAGAVLLSWQGEGVAFNLGAVLVAAACLAWGLDNNFTRKISATDPVVIAMLKGLVAGVVNVGLALAGGASFPPASIVAVTAAVGFFVIGVSLVMFIVALRHLGTARTGAYYSLAPFIGALLAIVILGDAVTLKLAVTGLLMAFGLWLHLSERHEHEHDHEELEHEHSHVHDEHHQHHHDGPVSEPHSHWHRHAPMRHRHPHYPDLHHRHGHG
ncbi:DMT family transporter [Mesorhizobium sophorae]|uniref:DMT family transporter n=1 Tax=Mesorhizobium sophorae TaxID=1300294 RepID=UPI000BA2BCE5|nr:DMT family transporter [Mesorhizobium sophorae]